MQMPDQENRALNYWFDRIYDAAKTKNEDALKKILEQKNIDQRYLPTFQTPAGKLAAEGDKESVALLMGYGANLHLMAMGVAFGGDREYAEDLRINHHAGVNYIAQGAAEGGHREYAEFLRINYDARLDLIAEAAAAYGHYEYAEYLRINFRAKVKKIVWGASRNGNKVYVERLCTNHGVEFDLAAEAAAFGGHFDYAEDLYINHSTKASSIAEGASNGGYLNSPYQILHLLVLTNNNELRIAYAARAKKINNQLDTETLLIKAVKLTQLMIEFQYDFNQALSFMHMPSTVRLALITWLFQGIQLLQQDHSYHLPAELFEAILIFLIGIDDNLDSFCSKIKFATAKKLLITELETIATEPEQMPVSESEPEPATSELVASNTDESLSPIHKVGLFAREHREKAGTFLNICNDKKNLETMVEFLNNQNKEDDFYHLYLERHHKRFTS